jgi:hypothetical protein
VRPGIVTTDVANDVDNPDALGGEEPLVVALLMFVAEPDGSRITFNGQVDARDLVHTGGFGSRA